MRHTRYGNVFALGDAGSSPNSKTEAAIRKQAPVAAANLVAVMNGKEPGAAYDGYASCQLTTARNRMLLAKFDYTMRPHPTFPGIDSVKERYDMWLLKRYGLPYMYWNLMLKGSHDRVPAGRRALQGRDPRQVEPAPDQGQSRPSRWPAGSGRPGTTTARSRSRRPRDGWNCRWPGSASGTPSATGSCRDG